MMRLFCALMLLQQCRPIPEQRRVVAFGERYATDETILYEERNRGPDDHSAFQ